MEQPHHFGLFWNWFAWVVLCLMLLGLIAKIGEFLIKMLRHLPPLNDATSSPEDFPFLRTWPAPLRWAILLPASVLSYAGLQLIVGFFAALMIESAYSDFEIPRSIPTLIAKIVSACVSGFWFVVVGVKIAPAAKTKVALGLAILCGTLSLGAPAYLAIKNSLSWSTSDIISVLLTTVAGAYAYIEVQRRSITRSLAGRYNKDGTEMMDAQLAVSLVNDLHQKDRVK